MKSYTQILKESMFINSGQKTYFDFNLKGLKDLNFLSFLNGKRILELNINDFTFVITFDDFTQLNLGYSKGFQNVRFSVTGQETRRFPDNRTFEIKNFQNFEMEGTGDSMFLIANCNLARDFEISFYGYQDHPPLSKSFRFTYTELSREDAMDLIEYFEDTYGRFSAHERLKLMAKLPK